MSSVTLDNKKQDEQSQTSFTAQAQSNIISVQTRVMICEVAMAVVRDKRKCWEDFEEEATVTGNRKKVTTSMDQNSPIPLIEPISPVSMERGNSSFDLRKEEEAVFDEEGYFASNEGRDEDEEVVSDDYEEEDISDKAGSSGKTVNTRIWMPTSRRMIEGCFETPGLVDAKWDKLRHTAWAPYNNDGFEKGDELLSYQEFLDKRSERRKQEWEDTLKKKKEKYG